MKITKQKVQAAVDNIIYFQCPACQTKALVDVDNEVRSLLDVDYQDRFVCEECGEEFLGEIGYDMKPEFTRITDDIESATNTCGIAARPDQLKKPEDEVVSAATPPYRKREIIKSLQDKLINRCAKWFRDDFGHMDDSELAEFLPELGYNDLNDMFVVEVTLEDDGRIRAEVRAELSYDGLYDLGEACNPIVQKYDKEAYFDMDQPGIMSAYLDLDSVYGSITNKINFGSGKHKQSDPQSEYEYRKNVYLKRKHEFETLGEDDNNDVLSREEKMNIAKAEMDKVNPKSVKSAKDATFKNDKRLSTTSERYKGYLIVSDRGGDGYNVYDKHRELEDAGYPSRDDAKKFIDELVADDNDIYASTNSEYALFKKTYSHSREFKDKDKQSGSIRDLIDELENKDISYEIYDNKTDNGCTVFYDDDGTVTAASYGGAFDIEDDQYSAWRELASKSVEDSDGFNTDYTLYTNGETYICMFGDKDLYEPDASYADYETENEQDAWDWFNSYTGFADEEDEYDIYGSEDLESDFNEYEDDIQEISQEFTSENTSINSTKLPAIFKMVSFEPGTTNIDYGGGRFDNVADYLTQYDVINLVYDPYNRSKEHNKEVIRTLRKAGGADTATCSNVLNVIKEPEVRKNVLENISKIVKPGGKVYITVYEGSGKGDEGPTKAGYQLNRRTADYLDEIREVFPDANRKGKLIVATNSRTVNSSTNIKASSTEGYVYTYCDECGKKNRVKVTFNNFNEPFNDTEYKCKYCGTNNLLTDPHSYDENGNVVEAPQSYLDRIEELMNQGLDEETASREAYAEFYPDEYDVDDYDEIYSANYGGAYDVDPEQYFTREDLDELGYSVAELVSLDLDDTVEYAGAWIEPNNELTVELKSTDYDSSVTLKVDMRKIRRPQDLTAKYAQKVADESIKQFKDWYQDEEAINSSEAIDAQYRSWYEPDDDDYIDVDEVEDVVEIDLDGTQVRIYPDQFDSTQVRISPYQFDDFVDKEHKWAKYVEIEIPDFNTWVTVPSDQVEDDVWDMIADMLPEPTDEEEIYTLYGEVRLCYRVSNVFAEELNPIREPEGDYGYNYETYTDDAEIEFIRDKSQVVSLRIE